MVLGTAVNGCKLNLKVGDMTIQQVGEVKLLGVIVDENLTWEKHIDKLCGKICRKLGLLKQLKESIPSKTIKMLYNSLLLPHCDCAGVVWCTASNIYVNKMHKLQKHAARILTGSSR